MSNINIRLDGKVALVTGAGRGIGATCAEVLAEAGAKVIVADVMDDWGKGTVERIKGAGGEARYLHLDVSQEAQWETAVKAAIEAYGGYDILVNNAGVEGVAIVENIELEMWRRVMGVNSDGVFLGVKHGIRAMKPGGAAGKGGSIINMVSICGKVAVFSAGAYSASKGAVGMLTKVAAVECGKLNYGIRVNSVYPGFIRTELVEIGFEKIAREYGTTPAEVEAAQIALHPIGRLGSTLDIAQAVLYLASDISGFVTGSDFMVDGGLTAM